MTALAQGSAGVALVMCFALLHAGQINTAAILLAVQSVAVAVTATVLHRPLMAIPPLVLAGGLWLARHGTPMLDPRTAPVGGAKLGIGAGAALAILCQSQDGLALPLTILLLSILLATTRTHPLMQVGALVGAQNGLALAGSLVAQPAVLPADLYLPFACLCLPLPLAAGLLVPAVLSSRGHQTHGMLRLVRPLVPAIRRAASWFGWLDLGLALGLFAATLLVPLDALASIFAPLLALDGVLRSCARRKRRALVPERRAAGLAQSGFGLLAVCAPNMIIAWLAVVAAMAMTLLPVLSWRWTNAVLAFLGAGLALFGMLLLPPSAQVFGDLPVVGCFSLFVGFATIAAVVPDLAVVLVILILRLADQASWPPVVGALGIAIALCGLLACAILLTNRIRSHRTTLLLLSQSSIALLAIFVGQAEGRFAALVVLILLILTRAAARLVDGPAAALAIAGLAGMPPLGVFPGLVLVVLALSANDPWLLVPLGVALIPIVLAGIPRRTVAFRLQAKIPSVAWLPLALAVLAGYFAPEGLINWWRILTAGRT